MCKISTDVRGHFNGKDVLAVHVTEYGKSLIFQLLPDIFDWYYCVIIIVLFTIIFQQHRQRILICIGFTFTRVSLCALKDNIRYCGTSCHCFQATNRNWLKIRFPQSLPRRSSTEWEDYTGNEIVTRLERLTVTNS